MTCYRFLDSMTPDELLDAYAAWQAMRGFSPRTIDRRRWTYRRWLAHLDGRCLFDAGPTEVEVFLAGFPTAQTRYTLRADLHQLYRFAVRRGATTTDPTDQVDPPKVPRRLPTPIPSDKVRLAILAAQGPLRLMLMFGALAGLRVSEIAALRGEDVEGDVIVVRGGKGGVDRAVPMHPGFHVELPAPRPGPLFPGMTGAGVSRQIRRHFRRMGICARPHDLRHSFATEAARVSAGNITLVQQLLGHSSPVATQRYMGWAAPGATTVLALYDPRRRA